MKTASEQVNQIEVDGRLMDIPTDYIPGYRKALTIDPEMASKYVAHTLIGDPVADRMMEDLSRLDHGKQADLIRLGMDYPGGSELADAPDSLREFFNDAERRPDWLDYSAFDEAIRMFHRNSGICLTAILAAVLVEGYTTNIAKSFVLTGRTRDQGIRRLGQNSRHVVEVFFPGGLDRESDGWKTSVRIRIVHARVRRLLSGSDDWDTEAWGIPICAAHTGFASVAFSARLLQHMKTLGADWDEEERTSFMDVWRYTAFLIGIPETILFREFDDALNLHHIGLTCEPAPSLESIVITSSLMNQAGLLSRSASDAESRIKEARYAYRLSQALVGDELAKSLNYPDVSTFGVIGYFRFQQRLGKILNRLIPGRGPADQLRKFEFLLNTSVYDKEGISYELPDHAYSEESKEW